MIEQPIDKSDKETLRQFQCDYNRLLEENFAQTLAERADVRLFFINENEAFTDGRNIIVDPACNNLFADTRALEMAEQYLKLDSSISKDRWLALRMTTRAQNIHEALHIVYSNFPGNAFSDPRNTSKTRRITLCLLSNIIEDAFIEAAACSIFDNLEPHLLWWRMAKCCSNVPEQGTVSRAFSDIDKSLEVSEQENAEMQKRGFLMEYLEYMACFLLYPMIKQEEPLEILRRYVDATKQLFLDGCMCGDANERYIFVQRIFDIIEPLIPGVQELDTSVMGRMLNGIKTHTNENSSIKSEISRGKTAKITRRLFFDEKGAPVSHDKLNAKLAYALNQFRSEQKAASLVVNYQGSKNVYTGGDFECANIHKDITVEVCKPKINLNLRKAYQNIHNRYRINISGYNTRFQRLLRGWVDTQEEKRLFGSGISSNRLGDVKKRYWYRKLAVIGIPDVAIMLMIDGSGSMKGPRRESAIIASVVLHEVLRKNGIEHAIVEHRAIYGESKVVHNILTDFNAREEEKYNLLALQAEEGTREGLSLYWAERYLTERSSAENKLIIMISDGVPAHSGYEPPVSVKDTLNAARKIIGRGIHIIAVAIDNDGEDDCYQKLREIYPYVISCSDLKRLTGKILGLITKFLAR